MAIKIFSLVMVLTTTTLTTLPVFANNSHHLSGVDKSNRTESLKVAKKTIKLSPSDLKEGINRVQINSREWVEISVKGDYITQVALKNQDGRYSKLKIKSGSAASSQVTGEGYWYFKSNGCACWEDEAGQQSVCSDACFNSN